MPRWGVHGFCSCDQGRCPWLGCVTPSGYRLNFLADTKKNLLLLSGGTNIYAKNSATHVWVNCAVVFVLRRLDSNERPPGYEPGELPTAPLRDVGNLFFSPLRGRAFRGLRVQKYDFLEKWPRERGVFFAFRCDCWGLLLRSTDKFGGNGRRLPRLAGRAGGRKWRGRNPAEMRREQRRRPAP